MVWASGNVGAAVMTEDFTGYGAGALTGNSGGTGPWSGAWGTPGNSVQVNTTSGGLGTVSTISSTDPVGQAATSSGSPLISTRSFTTITGQSAVYFHVLLSIDQGGNFAPLGEGGVDFFNGSGDEQFIFGKLFGSANWGITARPGSSFDSQTSGVAVPDDTTTLVVGKIDQVNNVATLWINPDLTLLESANSPALTLSYNSDNDDFDTVRLRAAGTTGDTWRYDNLSIFSNGDSPFAMEMLAVPEPGVAALVLLGGVVIHRRRRAG